MKEKDIHIFIYFVKAPSYHYGDTSYGPLIFQK